MNDAAPSAAALLDRIDLSQDNSQIARAISSILNAPDYHQLFSTFQGDPIEQPPEKAAKFVNALDKVCVSSVSSVIQT